MSPFTLADRAVYSLAGALLLAGASGCGGDDGPGQADDPVTAFLGTYDIAGTPPNNCYNVGALGEIRRGSADDQIHMQYWDLVVTFTIVANVTSSTSFEIDEAASPIELPGFFEGGGTRSGSTVSLSYDNSQGFICDSSWTRTGDLPDPPDTGLPIVDGQYIGTKRGVLNDNCGGTVHETVAAGDPTFTGTGPDAFTLEFVGVTPLACTYDGSMNCPPYEYQSDLGDGSVVTYQSNGGLLVSMGRTNFYWAQEVFLSCEGPSCAGFESQYGVTLPCNTQVDATYALQR